ncbi:MAG: 7-cyano-7-deazaguanine synthase QueC [Euryarchaeota archaeon]|nr:7-cyano-7-deazaguanine synthase QueC [Euryarchaeota archaeon]
MDSATTLAIARSRGHPVVTLSVQYGQRHQRELRSARALSRHFGAREALEVVVPLGKISPSALTTPGARVPKDRRSLSRAASTIPSTYVPARNTILLGLALAVAETRRAEAIYLGVNAVDYSGYPDCRPAFLSAFGRLARLATARGVEGRGSPTIEAPLLHRTKTEIVRWGERLRVPWELTWSCYEGGRRPCGHCDSCRLREKGFREAGVADPLVDPPKRARR